MRKTGNQKIMDAKSANGVEPERPVTTAELAEHLRCTSRTIANYRAQKLIPFWRLNARRILYRISDVESALSK
jgi:Helix-turn-helix domain